MNVEEIREAKDENTREIYEMRSKILKDKVSALNEAKRKGIEQGIKKVAENLLDVLDNETIALKTGLTVSEVEQLRNK